MRAKSYIHYSENILLLRGDRALLRVVTRGHHKFLQQKTSIVSTHVYSSLSCALLQGRKGGHSEIH